MNARQILESLLWPDGARCRFCESANVHLQKGAREGCYSCRDCHQQFSVTTGTVMQDAHDIDAWLHMIRRVLIQKASIREACKEIGCSYKTAYYIVTKLGSRQRWNTEKEKKGLCRGKRNLKELKRLLASPSQRTELRQGKTSPTL